MIVGSTSEVYRLNLEQGRFLAPFETESPGINCCGLSPYHGLVRICRPSSLPHDYGSCLENNKLGGGFNFLSQRVFGVFLGFAVGGRRD